jgi:hypothetical protein
MSIKSVTRFVLAAVVTILAPAAALATPESVRPRDSRMASPIPSPVD